jgi:hypothetical protein
MRRPTVRRAVQGLAIAVVLVAASGVIMRAIGVSVCLGQSPELGWTAYPMLAVAHWAGPGGPLAPGKLPPRQSREVMLGTLVTWADGTKALYIHP